MRYNDTTKDVVQHGNDWFAVREGDRIVVRQTTPETDKECTACAGTGVLALGLIAVGALVAGRAALRRLFR